MRNFKNLDDITLEDCKHYLRIEVEFTEDDAEIEGFILTAKAFLLESCNNDLEFLNSQIAYASILVFLFVSELYHNKSITVNSNTINPVFSLLMQRMRYYGVE